MTVNELYAALDALYPKTLSAPWDNDGRMVIPDGSHPVHKVLCCLDCDSGAVASAIRLGVDVIISHHPLVFKPLNGLDIENPAASKALALFAKGIAVFSFHTRLDCGVNGVNDTLASLLGVENVTDWIVDGLPMGRIGALPAEISGAELAAFVKDRLGCPALRAVCPEKRVRTVALMGGSGGSDFKNALAAGADAFITGEASHHNLLDAADLGLCLIAAGHDYTERAVARSLCATVNEIDPSIELCCYDRVVIETM